MDYSTIENYKQAIQDTMNMINIKLDYFDITNIDSLNIDELKDLNIEVNNEFNDFFGFTN